MVVDALQEVGAARSIVIDEKGVVLAGNATIKAAGQAGLARASKSIAMLRQGARSLAERANKWCAATILSLRCSMKLLLARLKLRSGGASFDYKAEESLDWSFQHGVLESRPTWMSPEASLRTWMPAIHAGMTNDLHFHVLWASVRS